MYDTNGKFLQAFTTITEASTALNISRIRAIDIITNKILGDFESQYTAGKHFKIRPSNISEVCSGKRKSAGKYNGHPIL